MRKRLFIYTTLIIFAALLCFFVVTVYSISENNRRIAEDNVREAAKIYAGLYSGISDLSIFSNTGGDTRVTVIAADGTVLADSSSLDLDSVGTHLGRPEIQAAAAGAPATYMRYSSTLGMYLIYYAIKADNADGSYVFIRTSIPVEQINSYLSESFPFLVLIFVIIILLCFVFSRAMINRMTKPLESVRLRLEMLSYGDYTHKPLSGDFEEIDAIVREIDDVAQVLQENMRELRGEKLKAEYVLNNISDGIFAVNNARDIALVNNAAQDIFGVTGEITGKSINCLTFDKALLGSINDCIDAGRSTLSEFSRNGRTYILTVKPIEDLALTMVVLSDITDSRENARRREEFFDNASHELKTPLTAIRGFAELCELNNKDEGIKKYISNISRETNRMLSLIADMLKLSELTNVPEINPVPVPLRPVACEVQETLSAAIDELLLEFEITGDCTVSAGPEHVFELLKNLIENAVRYNIQGGSVSVVLEANMLRVSDTGIGIPYEAQTRLFERFYRVEKSRSIRSGGTGLGLSIVRHICALYNWELSLKSKPGIGTDVTVVFRD